MVLDVEDSEAGVVRHIEDMEDGDRIRVHLGENLYQELLSNKGQQDQKSFYPFSYFFR